jgi:hypothetical protein
MVVRGREPRRESTEEGIEGLPKVLPGLRPQRVEREVVALNPQVFEVARAGCLIDAIGAERGHKGDDRVALGRHALALEKPPQPAEAYGAGGSRRMA